MIVVNSRHRGAFCMELDSIDSTPPRTFDLGEKRNKAAGIGFVFTAALLPSSGLRSRSLAPWRRR